MVTVIHPLVAKDALMWNFPLLGMDREPWQPPRSQLPLPTGVVCHVDAETQLPLFSTKSISKPNNRDWRVVGDWGVVGD